MHALQLKQELTQMISTEQQSIPQLYEMSYTNLVKKLEGVKGTIERTITHVLAGQSRKQFIAAFERTRNQGIPHPEVSEDVDTQLSKIPGQKLSEDQKAAACAKISNHIRRMARISEILKNDDLWHELQKNEDEITHMKPPA